MHLPEEVLLHIKASFEHDNLLQYHCDLSSLI